VSGVTKWRTRLGRQDHPKRPTDEIGAAGDLGRRIATRRTELHLTIEQVADRAGMAPDYLDYVEHAPTVGLSAAGLTRLSLALEIPINDLLGGSGTERQVSVVRPPTRCSPRLIETSAKPCCRAVGLGGSPSEPPDRWSFSR
jgi:hypothetical protein